MRITVSIVVNLSANGMSKAEILDDYPYLEPEDIEQCINYAALSKKCPINLPANYLLMQQKNYKITLSKAVMSGIGDSIPKIYGVFENFINLI